MTLQSAHGTASSLFSLASRLVPVRFLVVSSFLGFYSKGQDTIRVVNTLEESGVYLFEGEKELPFVITFPILSPFDVCSQRLKIPNHVYSKFLTRGEM